MGDGGNNFSADHLARAHTQFKTERNDYQAIDLIREAV